MMSPSTETRELRQGSPRGREASAELREKANLRERHRVDAMRKAYQNLSQQLSTCGAPCSDGPVDFRAVSQHDIIRGATHLIGDLRAHLEISLMEEQRLEAELLPPEQAQELPPARQTGTWLFTSTPSQVACSLSHIPPQTAAVQSLDYTLFAVSSLQQATQYHATDRQTCSLGTAGVMPVSCPTSERILNQAPLSRPATLLSPTLAATERVFPERITSRSQSPPTNTINNVLAVSSPAEMTCLSTSGARGAFSSALSNIPMTRHSTPSPIQTTMAISPECRFPSTAASPAYSCPMDTIQHCNDGTKRTAGQGKSSRSSDASSSTEGTPPRKTCRRVKNHRVAINQRLRNRSKSVRFVLQQLRDMVPTDPNETHLTTGQLLRRAAYYIQFLADSLGRDSPVHSEQEYFFLDQ
eukprot:scpid66794/ scgid16428/ 